MPVQRATTSAMSSDVDLLLEEAGVAVGALLGLGQAPLQVGDLAVAQLGGPLEVGLALGLLGLAVRLLQALLDLLDALDGVLLRLPLRLHAAGALAQLGELAVQRLEARGRGLVALALQRRALDLELHDAPLDLVDLLGQRVDLDAQPRAGLVDEVDRLVGKEAIGDVAGRQRCGGDERGVLDADAVMDLVALLEAAQDRDRVLDGGLADVDRLEPALEGGVLLDVLAVLVERRGADRAQLAAREHRLEEVRGVHGALRGAGADDRVQLVHEQDDLALGVLDVLEDRLQALLELAAVLRAGEQRADVERDDAAVAQRLGDVAGDDPLGEALDDGGLADTRIPDEDGVVLAAAGEDLHDAADLVVAADDRVELALGGLLGEVAAEALERVDLLLGALVGHAVAAADLRERLEQRLLGRPGGAQRVAGLGVVPREREQEMLGGDVLVAQLAHLVLSGAQHLHELGRGGRLGGAAERRKIVEGGAHLAAQPLDGDAELAQDAGDDGVALVEQDCEQVLGLHLGMAGGGREVDGRPERLLGLDREAVCLHQLPGSAGTCVNLSVGD